MYMCGTCILLCCVVCVYRLVCAFHLFLYLFFFFFKQKTAYEMRISDWSSDVCSLPLVVVRRHRAGDRLHQFPALGDWLRRASDHDGDGVARAIGGGHDAYIIIAGGARRELLPRAGLVTVGTSGRHPKIGRAHVGTPVTNAHLVCRLLLEQ